MSSSDPWVEVIADCLGPPIFTTGDEVRFNCFKPSCGSSGTRDTHYHMYVNPVKGKYFCQRCQQGGSLEQLAKYLRLPAPEDTLTMWDRILHSFLFGTADEEEVVKVVGMPKDYHEAFPGTKAYKYILSRGVSKAKIDHYRFGFGTERNPPEKTRHLYAGKNRVIIPDFDSNGEVVYWVARTYGKHRAKYKNARVPRESQVFNLDRVMSQGYPRIVICEGPLSAIVAGYDAVCTYGKYVTGRQISKLAKAKAKEYIVAFDGDAVPEAVSLATRLGRRGLKVKVVIFNRVDDPASVGSLACRKLIREAVAWSSDFMMEVMV